MNISNYNLETIVVDRLRLDGGAMFGSVPKPLWAKRAEPDELNRITLACRLLKITSEKETFLVDLGCGSKWDEKSRKIYSIENLKPLPKEVHNVILTHLHFDHVGGVSYLDSNQELQPSFKEANYYLSKTQFEHAAKSLSGESFVRDKASFLKENIDVLASLKLNFTNHSQEIAPNITAYQASGHTPGLQWLKISSPEKEVVYPSDLIPTSAHLDPLYVMGYDLNAQQSLKEKKLFLEEAISKNWIIIFQHDPKIAAATIKAEKNGKIKICEEVEI